MERPSLFNTEMVRAILDGRKVQTRRLLKPKYRENEFGFQVITNLHDGQFIRVEYYDEYEEVTRYMEPPCNPGDILWVRETWCPCASLDSFFDGKNLFVYKADYAEHSSLPCGWKPSIHMPKEAARIFLRVKDVRVERLQDISAADIRAEGLSSMCAMVGDMEIAQLEWRNLWNSTIKKADLPVYGWEANPWVWVIEFERIERPASWEV